MSNKLQEKVSPELINLWGIFCILQLTAQKTLRIEDGLAARNAWLDFLEADSE